MQVELNKDNIHGVAYDEELAMAVLRRDLVNYDISRAKLVIALCLILCICNLLKTFFIMRLLIFI